MNWKFWEKRQDKPAPQDTWGIINREIERNADVPISPLVFDRYSATWQFIQAHCSKRIQDLRERNDSVKKDAVMTAVIRGEIRALKDIISLGISEQAKKIQPIEYDDRDLGGF